MYNYRHGRSSNQSSFRSDKPLTHDQIMVHAPSVLATEPHSSRGERYAYIPTVKVLEAMQKEGFQPYEVRQTRCRDLQKRDFTKHMVRMRHESLVNNSGEVGEIILVNSHDGTSSYQIMAGFFRFVCSNGLIAGDVVQDVRIMHKGDIIGDVIEGSYEVLKNIQEVAGRVDEYKMIQLSEPEQLLLAHEAATLRWDEETMPVEPHQLIRARRFEDRGNTLWGTFNNIQENIMQGGMRGISSKGQARKVRGVGGVTENIKLNKALWSLTEQMAKLKAA